MQTITVERVIAAPLEEVFEWCSVTTNYERSRWVLRCTLDRPGAGAPYGVGAIRLHTWLIGRFDERVTRYDAPHSFDYVVDRSFPPARHEGGSMTFTEVPGGTKVVWTTRAEVAIPFGADLVTRMFSRPVVARVFRSILAACERELTGQ
ncbi:SRPBCC family protein [Nocardia sp. NPDC127579]|uniref:SRPBCC family protein n=1 Tax=Nocardia sp. NPDC127579 TaxID=3345402 RepID=UPI00363E530B